MGSACFIWQSEGWERLRLAVVDELWEAGRKQGNKQENLGTGKERWFLA